MLPILPPKELIIKGKTVVNAQWQQIKKIPRHISIDDKNNFDESGLGRLVIGRSENSPHIYWHDLTQGEDNGWWYLMSGEVSGQRYQTPVRLAIVIDES